jgi:hypothetical protein
MRILIRIVHDADKGNALAADLPDDIAVEVFCRDHRYSILGTRWSNLPQQGDEGEREHGGFHAEQSLLSTHFDRSSNVTL